MRLFGSGPMKFPPPLLCLQSPAPPHRGGLIDNLGGKKKWGWETEAGRDERTGNKGNELTNAWFTYMDLKLPVVSPFQYIVAREGNKITLNVMAHKRAKWVGKHLFFLPKAQACAPVLRAGWRGRFEVGQLDGSLNQCVQLQPKSAVILKEDFALV